MRTATRDKLLGMASESRVQQCYYGSNGDATLQLMVDLASRGPAGELAAVLFRCMKASAKAKLYRGANKDGDKYRDLAYERKGTAMCDLADMLDSAGCDDRVWGWQVDKGAGHGNIWVLYVELPTGQVSFHSPQRFAGPYFRGGWDARRSSEERVIEFCELILEPAE